MPRDPSWALITHASIKLNCPDAAETVSEARAALAALGYTNIEPSSGSDAEYVYGLQIVGVAYCDAVPLDTLITLHHAADPLWPCGAHESVENDPPSWDQLWMWTFDVDRADETGTYTLGPDRDAGPNEASPFFPDHAGFNTASHRISANLPAMAGLRYRFRTDYGYTETPRDVEVKFADGANTGLATHTLITGSGHDQDTVYSVAAVYTAPAGTEIIKIEFSSFSGTWVDDFQIAVEGGTPEPFDRCA